jgi:hypothetical protein
MSIRELTELSDLPQIAVERESKKAVPLLFPTVPPTEQEKIFAAVMEACNKALKDLALDLTDLHKADPLGLKFPSTIRT